MATSHGVSVPRPNTPATAFSIDDFLEHLVEQNERLAVYNWEYAEAPVSKRRGSIYTGQSHPDEPFFPASVGGRETSAFPDTGAAANFVSLEYAVQLGYRVELTSEGIETIRPGKKRLEVLFDALFDCRATEDFLRHKLRAAKLRRQTHSRAYRTSRALYEDVVDPFRKCDHSTIDSYDLAKSREAMAHDGQAREDCTREMIKYRSLVVQQSKIQQTLKTNFTNAVRESTKDTSRMNVGGHPSTMKNAKGSLIKTLGAMTLPFSFAGEQEVHMLEFHVLRDTLHDIILGSPFLRLNETFTKNTHRVKHKIKKMRFPRLCSVGAQQQWVSGRVNGHRLDAVPDTGAEVSVISASLARKIGLAVNKAEGHRVSLELADGEIVRAIGAVESLEWRFGKSGPAYNIKVHVLQELAHDMYLGYDFLRQSAAFTKCKKYFWNDVDGPKEDSWIFSIIKLTRNVLRTSKSGVAASSTATISDDPGEQWRIKKGEEIKLYQKAKQDSQHLPEDQRQQFLEAHLARWQRFLETHPGHVLSASNASPGTSSSPPSPALSQVEVTPGQIPVQPVKPAKSSSRFGMGLFKRNPRRSGGQAMATA